jgi:hypothetical protein
MKKKAKPLTNDHPDTDLARRVDNFA